MNYIAFPFDPSIPREAVSTIFRAMFEQESLWIDQLGACEDLCAECPRDRMDVDVVETHFALECLPAAKSVQVPQPVQVAQPILRKQN